MCRLRAVELCRHRVLERPGCAHGPGLPRLSDGAALWVARGAVAGSFLGPSQGDCSSHLSTWAEGDKGPLLVTCMYAAVRLTAGRLAVLACIACMLVRSMLATPWCWAVYSCLLSLSCMDGDAICSAWSTVHSALFHVMMTCSGPCPLIQPPSMEHRWLVGPWRGHGAFLSRGTCMGS